MNSQEVNQQQEILRLCELLNYTLGEYETGEKAYTVITNSGCKFTAQAQDVEDWLKDMIVAQTNVILSKAKLYGYTCTFRGIMVRLKLDGILMFSGTHSGALNFFTRSHGETSRFM